MIIVGGDRFRLAHVADVDDAEAAVPAAGEHLVAEAQCVVQAVPLAGPRGFLAGGDILSRQPPARDFLRTLRVAHVVGDQHGAEETVHLRGDVGVALVHVEAVHAAAAGQLMVDQLRLRSVGDIVDAKAAVAIGLLFGGFDFGDAGLGDVEPLRQFGARRLALKRFAQLAAHARHLLGAPADRRHVALVVDHHDIAGDTHLVAVRGRIVERDAAHDTRIGRIGDIDDRGAELFFVGDVADIGVVAGDIDLAGAGQIEMADAPHVAGERAVRPVDFIHRLSPWA